MGRLSTLWSSRYLCTVHVLRQAQDVQVAMPNPGTLLLARRLSRRQAGRSGPLNFLRLKSEGALYRMMNIHISESGNSASRYRRWLPQTGVLKECSRTPMCCTLTILTVACVALSIVSSGSCTSDRTLPTLTSVTSPGTLALLLTSCHHFPHFTIQYIGFGCGS